MAYALLKLCAALSVSLMPVCKASSDLYANVMGLDIKRHIWVLVATVTAMTLGLGWIYTKISSVYFEMYLAHRELARLERILSQGTADYRMQLLDEASMFGIGLTNAVYLISLTTVLLLGPTALSLQQ
jgi:hypothetical protein